jgi:abequosyltransferase
MSPTLRLSICIATLNRAHYIAATLDSILPQLTPEVELVIVDGASTDGTSEILRRYAELSPQLRYFREPANSGVDADYDKAVVYAQGEFCWLMTDDDLFESNAVQAVLRNLDDSIDLLVVNAQVMDATLSTVLVPRLLGWEGSREYQAGAHERLFREVADYLTFIGGVVVRKSFWMARDRATYFGSFFVHAGVLFQSPPVTRARALSDPLLRIRYGNAMWTSRTFEIWVFKWPRLVWSFPDFSRATKSAVCLQEPWKNPRRMLFYRGVGQYAHTEYQKFLADKPFSFANRISRLVAFVPGILANAVAAIYCVLFNRKARAAVYDLARCRHSNPLSRLAARCIGLKL